MRHTLLLSKGAALAQEGGFKMADDERTDVRPPGVHLRLIYHRSNNSPPPLHPIGRPAKPRPNKARPRNRMKK